MTKKKEDFSLVDYALSHVGLFGIFSASTLKRLPRRPIKRLIFLKKGCLSYLDLTLKTSSKTPLSGALHVQRAYFDALARPLPPRSSAFESNSLTALPEEISQPVKIWLDPPKNARHCLIYFRRASGRQSFYLSFNSRVQYHTRGKQPKITEPVFRSRDPYFLWMRTRQKFFQKDWQNAASAVARLRYLHDSYKARSMQDRIELAQKHLK